MSIESFIRNIIKRGTVSNVIPDTGSFPISQVQWGSDKVGNVEVIHPYGLVSVAPKGSLALMFSIFGHEENRAAIINYPTKRLRGLKEGEVAIGNWIAKSSIKFLSNGDVAIVCKGNKNITISGDCNITTTGNTTINTTGNVSCTIGGSLTANITGNANITCPTMTIDGVLNVTGDVTALSGTPGAITFTDIVNKYNAHEHTSSSPGNPTTAPLPPNILP